MTPPRKLQPAALLFASALAASLASACPYPQDAITLERDSHGHAVYLNAGSLRDLSEGPFLGGDFPRAAAGAAIPQLIRRAAGALKIDPKLIDAVVRVESGYRAQARSPKGALGLMQLIPATAARFGVRDAFDPGENVRGGTTYLSQLLKRFNGDVTLSLAAYNAGEGAVLRHGGIPPFTETRNYLREVTALYPAASSKRSAATLRSPTIAGHGSDVTRNSAPGPVPIYRYVDAQGVTHFVQ